MTEGVVRRWVWAYAAVLLLPVLLVPLSGAGSQGSLATDVCLATGMVGLSLLVVVFALPSRIPSLLYGFGVETVLRSHRFIAVSAVVAVLAHLVLALAGGVQGVALLDLRAAPPRVWAATTSTVALLLLVGLAARRRLRRPRFEGWRLLHLILAAVVLVAAALHVYWLQNLITRPLTRGWFVLLGTFTVVVAARRWLWTPVRMRRRSYVVESVEPAAGNAVTLRVRAQGHHGVQFSPGQFAWLKIGTSPFVFEEHPFTISSTAERPELKEFTIKALGDFSELVPALRPGRTVFLDGPYGSFTTDKLATSGYVFVAGGVGVTPALSMLRTLADRGDRHPHQLIVGADTVEQVVARDEVADLRTRMSLDVVEVISRPPPGWTGESGLVDQELLERVTHPRKRTRTDYFLCGPPGMVVAVGNALHTMGVPTRRIHTEQFDVI